LPCINGIPSLFLLFDSLFIIISGGDYIPRLRRIYKFFKHALVNSEIRKSATATFHTSPADLFEILLPHASTADESVSQEILECLLLLLQVSPSTAADCFRLWLESYEANVAETLRLIKHIDFSQGKHKRAAGAVDQHQLAGFLRGILAINEKISTKTGWANSRAQKFGATKSMVSECTLLAQHTLRKSERGRSFWSQLLTVMLLLLMLVLTAIAVWSLVCRTEYFPDYRSSCKGTERFLKRIPFEQWRIKSQRFVAGNLQHLAQFQQWAIDQRPVLEAAIKAMLEFANDAFSILSEIAYDAYKRAQQALR
jgi:hypothetical protein